MGVEGLGWHTNGCYFTMVAIDNGRHGHARGGLPTASAGRCGVHGPDSLGSKVWGGLEMIAKISYQQAAAILGCHVSNVAKLAAKGELTSSGQRGGSLDREKVEALGLRRAEERAARAARPPRDYKGVDPRPDHKHDWLSLGEVAGLLGVTKAAVRQRIRRRKLPAVESGARLWARRDLLEQVEAARLVRKPRRP